MANFSLLQSWTQILVPQPCFDKFFVEFDFFDVACLKITLSKCLGFGIILGSMLVKVPQLLKILGAKSAEGISIVSTSLELLAILSTLSYCYAKSFPFSAYGDAVFLLFQTAAIAYLVLHYGGQPGTGILYLGVLGAVLAFLLSPAAPPGLLWTMQASVMLIVVFARAIQAYSNLTNGHTGQLSIITFLLLFLGSAARIFTSVQETGDSTVILNYVVSTMCNGVIVAQIIYYWKATQQKLKRE